MRELDKIYVITNSANGKKYVGCSHNPNYRFKQHMSALKGHRHKNIDMQKDFDEFGEGCFSCEVVDRKLHLRKESEERAWMIKLKTYDERYGYNHKDPVMSPIRREHGLSCMGAHNPNGWCGEWWKARRKKRVSIEELIGD